jgi:hypothetical protein
MQSRPLCPSCNSRPVAVNYKTEERVHYRSQCDACLRKGKKVKAKSPAWYQAGYRKKPHCEHCGFEAKLPEEQLRVFYVDGNLKNNDRVNLRTVCLNCQPVVYKSRLPWKSADQSPGF